ncbi:MAG TPA: GNAT family N-acetyltransferase [Pyrinomonadaceae bacterium]|nr:GNAT family N-acetyltransferase [Pyrinomonadaceae bacterium]
MRDIPVIETERLRLTIPGVDAAPRMLSYVAENREHFTPWAPPEPVGYYTEKFWRDYLQASRRQFEQDLSMRLVFFLRDDEGRAVVGDCNFTNFVRGPFQACYLGYKIAKRAEGQGLMREALEAAIDYAFGTLRLHRIMANYVPTNERSGRLLRRLGFVVEGYARDYLLVGGAWRDHVLTSLTNTALKPEDVK